MNRRRIRSPAISTVSPSMTRGLPGISAKAGDPNASRTDRTIRRSAVIFSAPGLSMPIVRSSAGISRRRLEPLETPGEPIPVGTILGAGRQLEGPPVQLLQRIEHWAVMLTEQVLRNVQPVIWVDVWIAVVLENDNS